MCLSSAHTVVAKNLMHQPNINIMKKFLFLDFDGVLHPNFSPSNDHFRQIDCLLDGLIGSYQSLEIVISSSWRFHHSIDSILSHFPEVLKRLIAGATPEVEPGRYQRYREIRAYLSQYKTDMDWRALDDDHNEFPKDCPQLILCDGSVGISDVNIDDLRNWLKK